MNRHDRNPGGIMIAARIAAAAALHLLTALPAGADPDVQTLEVDQDRVATWNRFAASVHALHDARLAGREVRRTEVAGEYGGTMAKGYYYREASYTDARNGALLSRVRTDRDRPNVLHSVEVHIHDADGRVVRDYTAIYLPWSQNAPIRTFINLHGYHGELHAYRQFDASGDRYYERCTGRYAGLPVDLSLYEEEIRPQVVATELYRACFSGIQETVGVYRVPQ
jgi:hypothetical protein